MGEITYLLLNFNGCAVEVYEWMNDFIPHFIIYVITLAVIGGATILALRHVTKSLRLILRSGTHRLNLRVSGLKIAGTWRVVQLNALYGPEIAILLLGNTS